MPTCMDVGFSWSLGQPLGKSSCGDGQKMGFGESAFEHQTFQPSMCAPKRTHKLFCRTKQVCLRSQRASPSKQRSQNIIAEVSHSKEHQERSQKLLESTETSRIWKTWFGHAQQTPEVPLQRFGATAEGGRTEAEPKKREELVKEPLMILPRILPTRSALLPHWWACLTFFLFLCSGWGNLRKSPRDAGGLGVNWKCWGGRNGCGCEWEGTRVQGWGGGGVTQNPEQAVGQWGGRCFRGQNVHQAQRVRTSQEL